MFNQIKNRLATFAITALALCLSGGAAYAHCDTMDGPVVAAGQKALESKDLTPVLRWIHPEAEAEVKDAFGLALSVRGKGEEAKRLADQFFLETLVRLHREGEGAPYTGLKPAGTDPGPAISAADKAVASGSIEALEKLLSSSVLEGLRERFKELQARKQNADSSVEDGRTYVKAYVVFVHYAEGVFESAHGPAAPAEQPAHEAPKAEQKEKGGCPHHK